MAAATAVPLFSFLLPLVGCGDSAHGGGHDRPVSSQRESVVFLFARVEAMTVAVLLILLPPFRENWDCCG